MNTDDFSAYIIFMALLTLGFVVNSSLWASPALVFSSKEFVSNKNAYVKQVIGYSLPSALILMLVTSGVAWLVVEKATKLAWVCAFLAGTAWAFYEVLRRISYAMGKQTRLVKASLLVLYGYTNFIAVGIFWYGSISLEIGLLIWFFAFLSGSVVITYLFYNRTPIKLQIDGNAVLKEHWNYAKWPLFGVFAYWVATSGFFVIASYFVSEKELGALRASQNLIGLASVSLLVFENVLIPQASNLFYKSGINQLKEFVSHVYKKYISLYLVGILILVCLAMIAYDFFYKNRFDVGSELILYFAIYQLLMGLSFPLIMFLRVISETKFFLFSHALSAFFVITVGVFLCKFYGVRGAAAGFAIASFVFFTSILISYRLAIRAKEA